MATERDDDFMALIGVMKHEMFLIGQVCFEARYMLRYELGKIARENGLDAEEVKDVDFIREHDEALNNAVERILNIIRLADERVQELTPPRVC
ncbi:MAG TPA: hypothetical protein VMF88_10485 [Bacteroidota bacterium]|nr:hypothetical protein [Bacteroidota bacterium]